MEKSDRSSQGDSSVVYIYTAYITLSNGQRIYAKTRGHKAFRIPVRAGKR